MNNRPLIPTPWFEVGLTVLPGLVFLIHQALSLQLLSETAVHLLGWLSLLFLAASTAWFVISRSRRFPVPGWALVPLGFFAGFGVIMTPLSINFGAGCLLLVILGLGSAAVHGPAAGMLVLMGGILLASTAIEPGMYLAPGPLQRFLLAEGMIVAFMILTPVLVLRSRSILQQAAGLLIPLAAYSGVLTFALSGASGLALPMIQFSIGQAFTVASPFIALTALIAATAALYAWVSAVTAATAPG